MPFVHKSVDTLQDAEQVDGGDCVALVKANTPGLMGVPTSAWREGAKVIDSPGLVRGTAIATFVEGRYPQAGKTGKHAAYFLKHAGAGIWVMDQWKNDSTKPRVSKRHVPRLGKNKDGTYKNPSNNAEAFSVIER
jgi:hypothetical protein